MCLINSAQLKLVVGQLIFDIMSLERSVNKWEIREVEWKTKEADNELLLGGIAKDRDHGARS
jgi:hypothetical protein